MNNRFLFLLLGLTLCCLGAVNGQGISNKIDKSKWHQKNLDRIAISADSSFQQHLKIAKKLGYKLTDSLGKGKHLRFQSITSGGEPLYLITHSTTQAGKMTKTNSLYKNGSLGLELTGKSDLLKGKLGMWDGGAVLDNHVELIGRTTKQSGQSSTLSSHSTHVAGIMIAAGKNTSVIGMSSEADLKYWDFDNDASEIADASKNDGLYVSNHSYGIQAGWVYDENRSKWAWWGYDPASKTEDYKFGAYDDNTRQLDQIAFNAPKYLVVKSAGNSRSENGPDTSATNKNYFQKYYIRNTSTLDSIPRSRNNGYDIISTNANAKNILTVGALESSLTLPSRPSAFSLSSYSAWGPTDDGRIKPDIMGIGSNIYSTTNSTTATVTNLYEYNSGTSMASPQVAGSLFLLQQLYAQQNKGAIMRSATLKGLAIHTATDIGEVGPDYKTGWGVLDMEKAGSILLNKDLNHAVSELTLKNGESNKVSVVASGKGPLVVTITWTDPEGKAQGSVLNDRTPRLVNDLDLRVKDEANQYLPFILDPANPEKLAITGDNFRDNVEKIIVANAIPGKTYDIFITHKGTLTYAAQDYSLIVSGINGKVVCNPISSKNTYVKLLKINNASNNYTAENGSKAVFNVEFNTLTNGILNVFVDWNQDGDFDDSNEWVQKSTAFSNSSLSFSQSIPNTVSTLNNYHLRMIAADQTVANACVSPTNGEITDYALTITEPSYDIGVEKLVQSGGSFCAGTDNLFYATIRNAGAKSFGKFDVKLSIYEEGTLKKSYTKTLDTLQINEVKNIGFQTDVTFQNNKNYRYDIALIASSDQIEVNNTLSSSQTISPLGNPTVSGLSCSSGTTIAFTSSNNSFWFDANNLLLGTGNSISLPKGKSYFAGQGGVSQSLGPKTKYEFGIGTYYSNFGPQPIYEVKAPMVLESARLYIGTSGTIDFYVTDMNTGELVSFSSSTIAATRSQQNIVAPPNQITDDASDQGVVVNLNLEFPKAGKYSITQVCRNGASIYRSNRTKTDLVNAPTNIGFPYNSPDNIISLTGALYQGSVIYSGYYYFYDMKFKSMGCASERVAAPVIESISPTLKLTQGGTKSICPGAETINLGVNSNQVISYQWQKNLVDINGATKETFSPTSSGSYIVKGTNANGCTSSSDSFILTVFPSGIPSIYYNANGVLETTASKNIQWYLNDKAVTGISTNTFSPTSSGVYRVQGNDSNGCFGVSSNLSITILGTENEISSIQLYPNPTQGDRIIVQVPSAQVSSNYTIEIYDLMGQKRISKLLSNQVSNLSIDVSSLSTGTYMLRIPELHQEKVLKFVKN